jgi:hypothetical protein
MRAALLALCLMGCSTDQVDDCVNAGTDPCVTFHLTAAPALVDSLITAVAMWVTYDNFGTVENKLVQTTMQTPASFPIAVGLDLPTSATEKVKVRIGALAGPGPVAYRVVSLSPSIGSHSSQEVMMQQQELSGCFDNSRNGNETDVDCGDDCPPCAPGRHCLGAADCQSATCLGSGQCE